MPKKVVLASGNEGKLVEFRAMLASQDFDVHSQAEYGVESCPETGLSFVENAILKAQNAARQTGLPAIADDSGIAVNALRGAPGVYSARYAGEHASDEENLLKLITDYRACDSADSSCRFICVIVYVEHENDPLPVICEGIWQGEMVSEPRGKNGFGYDPIFWLAEHQCTSAELSPAVKNSLSHRGIALRKLVQRLTGDSA
jgi:XTP/dITP diphosphohydrolase